MPFPLCEFLSLLDLAFMTLVVVLCEHIRTANVNTKSLHFETALIFSSSCASSDSSTSSSDDSPARSVQSAAVPAPSALALSSLDKDEPRKSFGIKVQNLPVRSTGQSTLSVRSATGVLADLSICRHSYFMYML